MAWQTTYLLLAQRLVLPNQVIALRVHLMHLVVVLGEGTIKLGLQQGRVLLVLVQLFLQGLHDILHKETYYPSTHYFKIYNYSGCGNIPSYTAPCGASTPGYEP
jgi:hypothetical protein